MTPAHFWDKVAPKYARNPVGDFAAYQAKLARLRELLGAESRVLEIGCGSGSTALLLAPSVKEFVGADVSAEMVRIANEKLAGSMTQNLRFVQAGAADEVSGAPFDAVLAFSLLHLVPDLPAVLEAVRAQLKPDGLFISKTVCLKQMNFFVRLLVSMLVIPLMRLFGNAPYVAMLNRADVVRHLEQAGFEIIDSTYFGKSHLSPFIVARRTD